MWYIWLLETNRIPDWLIRLVLQISLRWSLRKRYKASIEERFAEKWVLIEKLRRSPIAIHTRDPNHQHYEVPTKFFLLVLGKWLKYSCSYWADGVITLDEAEEAMLKLTCERARLEDGMWVLDLGCGWGSLSLWIATHYPHCKILAISNSSTQQEYVKDQCLSRGFDNVEVIKADISEFDCDQTFDRVISVEMFEHMKNYEELMARIASWLKPGGLLFVHIFSHREFAREFDTDNPIDWMAQTFFSGGTMPSDDLLLYFQRDLRLVDHWRLGGKHYAKTLHAWLEKVDLNKEEIRQIFLEAYGGEDAIRWLVNWRLFFLICGEVWNLNQGDEYLVSHYLFDKKGE